MIEMKVPDLGEDIKNAEVVRILVAEGDMLKKEQPVLELETDKATFDLPCPFDGKVIRIHVALGDTLSVGQVVLSLGEVDVSEQDANNTHEIPTEDQQEDVVPPTKKVEKEPEGHPDGEMSQVDNSLSARRVISERDASYSFLGSPATRQLARELGVSLAGVQGSGPGGRVTKADVRSRASAKRDVTSSHGESQFPVSKIQREPTSNRNPNKDAVAERIPMSKLTRTTIERLTTAWQTIPHVTQHEDVDFTELESARREYQQKRDAANPKVTVTVLLIKAVLAALRDHPRFNASIDVERSEIVLRKDFNIGIAVDTEQGLLVPVLHHVDGQTIRQLADNLGRLVQLAHRRELIREQLRGASFTISNQGGIGGTLFTPIINPPEVAILGVSRTRKEQQPGGGERLILPLSLSYDHRVNNGADAVRFMGTLARVLQSPFSLLMEN